MKFVNPSTAAIQRLLAESKTIAVVGLSDDPSRPSHDVSRSMQDFGYRILPINPALHSWRGVPAYADLGAAVATLGPGERIDIVNVFRRPARVGENPEDAACLQAKGRQRVKREGRPCCEVERQQEHVVAPKEREK